MCQQMSIGFIQDNLKARTIALRLLVCAHEQSLLRLHSDLSQASAAICCSMQGYNAVNSIRSEVHWSLVTSGTMWSH